MLVHFLECLCLSIREHLQKNFHCHRLLDSIRYPCRLYGVSSYVEYLVSMNSIILLDMQKHSPWNCSNNSCLKFACKAQNLLLVIPSIIDSQYDLLSTPTGTATLRRIIWQRLFLSSLHWLHFFGNILFDGQTASRKYDPTVCWLIWSVAVILTFFDVQITFFPLLAFAGNILYFAWLNSASCSWRFLIFCCCASITPAKDGSMLTLLNGAPDEYEDPFKDVECVAVS